MHFSALVDNDQLDHLKTMSIRRKRVRHYDSDSDNDRRRGGKNDDSEISKRRMTTV
jgi:hypothetical protein